LGFFGKMDDSGGGYNERREGCEKGGEVRKKMIIGSGNFDVEKYHWNTGGKKKVGQRMTDG